MEIRAACTEEAEQACAVIRRSIKELCHADHQGDAPTLSLWLANKTAENMRLWIAQTYVFVAAEQGQMLGVGAMNGSGEITLNYVFPDARFRGISKGLLQRLELQATDLGIQRITLQSSLTALRLYESAGYRRSGPPTKGFGITFCHPMIKNLQSGLSGRCSRLGVSEGRR
jgi:GNAT superfamily N-acetyltransferase